MRNSNKNQPSFATLYKIFPFAVAVWLYCNWSDIKRILGNVFDVICLFVGLAMFYVLLLIGGAM